MNPLIYVIKKSIKNYFISLKHKPGKIFSIICFIALLALIIVSSVLGKSESKDIVSSNYYIGIATLVYIFNFLISLKLFNNQNLSFFMSDVNLVFTAPINPQKIMLYGFIKKVYTSALIGIFFIFQIPTLKNLFGLSLISSIVLLLTTMLFFILCSFFSLLMYGIMSNHQNKKPLVKKVINSSLIIVLVSIFIKPLFFRKDFLNILIEILNLKFFDYIPFVGWFKVITYECFNGFTFLSYLYVLLSICTMFLISYILYKMNLDFFEDVIKASETNEFVKQSKQNSNQNTNYDVPNSKPNKFIKKNINIKINSTGAKAIFYKHVIEYKKVGGWPISLFSLILLGIMFIIWYLSNGANFVYILYFGIYMMFISNITGKWNQEITKPYIFLIPEKSSKKIFYATLSLYIKYIVDGLLLFGISSILYKATFFEFLIYFLEYITIALVFIESSVLNVRIFGKISSQVIKSLFMVFDSIFILTPGFILSIILHSKLNFGNLSGYVYMIIYNVLCSIIILFLSKGILNNAEI